jgi:hypothetical protein
VTKAESGSGLHVCPKMCRRHLHGSICGVGGGGGITSGFQLNILHGLANRSHVFLIALIYTAGPMQITAMPTQDPDPTAPAQGEEEEDDYMSMIVAEPTVPKVKETYTQRMRRKALESEARGRTKSKAELALEEAAAREDTLAKSLLEDENASKSKGLKMMAKMGFKGGALGKKDEKGKGLMDGRVEPIGVVMKEDRGGIGLDSEKKRKIREEFESESKRVKAEEGGYRERVRKEREEAKLEGQVAAAQRVAERMHGEREEEASEDTVQHDITTGRRKDTKPLKSINVLWRGLIRKREEKERDRRMRYDLHQSLSRLPTYDDPDEDKDDRKALGKEVTQQVLVEDLEEEDSELDAFNELDPAERLEQLILHLRQEFNYCFWCKFQYPDTAMEGCAGLTEEDHD